MCSKSAALLMLVMLTTSVSASPASQEALDAWFNGNGAANVNEGSLVFLDKAPARPVHHHQNRIHIRPQSLRDGWTRLEQCHDHLDAVPAAQITYREGHIRNLKVTGVRNIKRAWIEGASVQLSGVAYGARLCISAETRALSPSGNGFYVLNNGPYMRKFLDGYYPMQVSLHITYPDTILRVIDISPTPQPGLTVSQHKRHIRIHGWFEGELRTQVQFVRR